MSLAVKMTGTDDIKALLKKALQDKYFDAVLGLYRQPSGDMLSLSMASVLDAIDELEYIAPLMPVQAARVISNIKFTETELKIACIVKPCEMRAVIELIKLKQIMPDKLFFISMDCGGAIDINSFKAKRASGSDPVDLLKKANAEFKDLSQNIDSPRYTCTICDKFIPKLSDLRIRSFGNDIYCEALTDKGADFLNRTGSAENREFKEYDSALSKLLDVRAGKRKMEREKYKAEVSTMDSFSKEISSCIRCHNCMVNCPMDYCKECIFRSPVFDHPSENYEVWLKRKGAVKLPADTLIFHLTRLNHMGTSCVSCGACESACPVGIKVSRVFTFIGEEVQKIFEYEPGRRIDEDLPVATFREKELDKI